MIGMRKPAGTEHQPVPRLRLMKPGVLPVGAMMRSLSPSHKPYRLVDRALHLIYALEQVVLDGAVAERRDRA